MTLENNTIDKFEGEYRFLSNFWLSPVKFDGVEYPSVEHAYQAAKTLNPQIRQNIQSQPTPNMAKKIGKNVELREDWESIKEVVMLDLLRQKFRDQDLVQLLLDTGDKELIEGNWWMDFYWGVCNGIGKNRLGILLMQVRDEIRQEKSQK